MIAALLSALTVVMTNGDEKVMEDLPGASWPCRSSCPVPRGADRFGFGYFRGFGFGEKRPVVEGMGVAVADRGGEFPIERPLAEPYHGFKVARLWYGMTNGRLDKVELIREIARGESPRDVLSVVEAIVADLERRYDTAFVKEVSGPADDGGWRPVYRYHNADQDYPIDIAVLEMPGRRRLRVIVESTRVRRQFDGEKRKSVPASAPVSVPVEVDI